MFVSGERTPSDDHGAEAFARRVVLEDMGVEVRSLEPIREGWCNRVFIVNDALVVRIPRTGHMQELMALEYDVLDVLRPRLSVRVPTPLLRRANVVVYERIGGVTLDAARMAAMSPRQRAALVADLSKFLDAVHSVDARGLLGHLVFDRRSSPEFWQARFEEAERHVLPRLARPESRGLVASWFDRIISEAGREPTCLVHCDLGPQHVLVDEATGRLAGILDFGAVDLGDRALDYGPLASTHGPDLVRELLHGQPDADAIAGRAGLYAKLAAVHRAVAAVHAGDRVRARRALEELEAACRPA